MKCEIYNEATRMIPTTDCKSNTVQGRFLWSNDCKIAITDPESVNKIVALDELLNSSDSTDINDLNVKLTDIYTAAAFKTLVYKKSGRGKMIRKHKSKPWLSNDLRLIRKEVRNLGRKVRDNPKNCFLLHSFSCAKSKFNRLRKKLKHEYYINMADKIDNLNCQNSNELWKILKESKTKVSSNTSSPPMGDFVNHYKSLLCSKKDNSMFLTAENEEIERLTPLDYPFTCTEVKLGIKNLKNGKSAGPDLLLNEFIKATSDILLMTLTKLFNKILTTGIIPDVWNLVQITSLYTRVSQK